jgi:hypothetical protein
MSSIDYPVFNRGSQEAGRDKLMPHSNRVMVQLEGIISRDYFAESGSSSDRSFLPITFIAPNTDL